jgi:hypothetical protein
MSDLTRIELGWARATLETIFPANACAALPYGIAELDIEGHLQRVRRAAPAEAAFGIRAAIWIAGLAPVFVLGRLCTIAVLAPKEREKVVLAVMASRVYLVRQLVMFLKQLGALLYAGAAHVRDRVHAPGEPRLVSARSLSAHRSSDEHQHAGV